MDESRPSGGRPGFLYKKRDGHPAYPQEPPIHHMETVNYLLSLTDRLSAGLARLPEELRSRHAAYLRAAQNADGGFSGREGGSDLYYTGFALRGLAVLDALTPDICERAAGFLNRSLTQSASIIDLFSLLYSCLLVQIGGGPDVLAGS